MTVAGNDNYKPGLVPPEPVKNNSWLTTNLAQLMVFLNGLILTITAFATLNIFINEIIKESLVKTSDRINAELIQSYESTELYFNSLALSWENFYDNKIGGFYQYVNTTYGDISQFKQIYIVADNQNDNYNLSRSALSNDLQSWGQRGLLDNDEEIDNQAIFNYLVQNNNNDTQLVFVPVSMDGEDVSLPVLQKKVMRQNGQQYYIIAVIDFDFFLEKIKMYHINFIRQIIITDHAKSRSIYGFFNNSAADDMLFPESYANVTVHIFGGRELLIKSSLKNDSRQAFLQKIPFLMLLFGVTLTLIGTLYVRNNQVQSRKMSKMNRELAYKNFELSQEMSERERLSQVIQKSAIENRSIINAVSDIIVELSAEGKIVFLNDAWVKVTGFKIEQSMGVDFFDLLHNDDHAQQIQNFNSFVRGQKDSYRSYAKLRSASGLFRAIELSISMIRYDDRNNMRVVGTITDVEERRRAEKALSEAEKKYRMIVENAAAGIYQVTPEGQFLSANPAFARVLGYERPEEVLHGIRKSNEELYVNVTERENFLSRIVSDHKYETAEFQVQKKDGSVIWVQESIRPVFDDEDNLLFYEGSMEDIDQRKLAELALIDAKLESDIANRSKSEFLANMSHELRTPLNSIIGFSDIIKTQAYGDIAQQEYIEYALNIHESGNRLLRVINQILDVSRIESGNRQLNEGVVDIQSVIYDVLALNETKIKASKIHVEDKTKLSSFKMVGDAVALKQMLINIMSNAIKHSPENGLIVIDNELDQKNRLCLSISDTGAGLTEEEIQKALSPFGQIDAGFDRKGSGTGLGLTLVQSLMDLHGGELEMVSQKGFGTTVTLMFPENRVAQLSNKSSDKSADKPSNKNEAAPIDNKVDDLAD